MSLLYSFGIVNFFFFFCLSCLSVLLLSSPSLDMCKEVMDGLRICFDFHCVGNLLYTQEQVSPVQKHGYNRTWLHLLSISDAKKVFFGSCLLLFIYLFFCKKKHVFFKHNFFFLGLELSAGQVWECVRPLSPI